MDLSHRLACVLAVLAVVVAVQAGDTLKSGPQTGSKLPGPFHPLNINGENAGEKHCLFCQYGTNPVAMVFARSITPTLIQLIKDVEAAAEKYKGQQMGACIIFLSDREKLADELRQLAKKENLKHVILGIDNPAGPERYNVAAEAEVTVVLYEDHTVRANHAFRKGQLDVAAIKRILADVPRIIGSK